jgi:hypothetical protein
MTMESLGQLLDSLSTRAKEMREAMKKEGASVKDQRHLDNGSPERAYWHAGYVSALDDVLGLIQKLVRSRAA